jgi:hypothetical protein
MPPTEVIQKINLINGQFTPAEASELVANLLREKINFHKVQRLQLLIGDHESETEELGGRIAELLEEKQKAKDFFAEIGRSGLNIVIKGTLEISFAD